MTQVPGRPPATVGVPSSLPDPSSFPPGHPLRQLGTQLGLGSAAAPATPHQPHAPAGMQRGMSSKDPLSRPYMLPSGGLLYPGHEGTVLITPMRGEQEEIMAGAGSGLNATPALRNIVQQCVDCCGVPYEGLLLEDWSAVLLHVLAASLGTDMIPLYPVCEHCNTQFDGSRPLSQVPCRVLHRALPGEASAWPPESTQDEDEDLRILRDMGLAGAAASLHQVFACGALEEPVEVTLSNGQCLGWRYLRLGDLVQAEHFAERAQESGSSIQAKLHTFISARYISTIDGKSVGVFEAMQWVKSAPMPLIMELRASTERRSFGYELSPSFRCPNGHSFRQRLPLSAAMFRRNRGSTVY